jgi:hypothetical protein
VGRYGIVVNLAIGMLAAEALQRLTIGCRGRLATVLALIAIALTVGDCWLISHMVQHSFAVSKPPIKFLAASPIRQELAQSTQPVRLFCRGANLPNLLGVASTPVYLGIGPNAYFDPKWAMPQPLPFDTNPTTQQIAWLRRAGVTHILSFEPLDLTAWPIQQVLATADPFLNRAWGRGLNEPFFLYTLEGARGRVYWESQGETDTAEITSYRANTVTISASSPTGGTLVLSDLDWPGWQAQLDGHPTPATTADAQTAPYRAIKVPAGKHLIVWTYQPASLWWGGIFSTVSCLLLVVLCCARSSPIHRAR